MKRTPEFAVAVRPVTDAELIHEQRRQVESAGSSEARRGIVTLRLEAGIVFIVCVLSTLLGPALAVLGVFSRAGNLQLFLYCLPQRVFPYQNLFSQNPTGEHARVFGAAAPILSMVQWSIVAIVFGWLVGGIKPRYVIFIAYAVIMLVTLAASVLFRIMGLTLDFDLP